MVRNQLRVYYGPQDDEVVALQDHQPQQVTVTLGEIIPLLADAVQSRRTWLRDFVDDEISISSDLHEVILAYQHFRRPSA